MMNFELEVPFVVVTSAGGPFDDDAYVAGFEAGRLDAWLSDLDDEPDTRLDPPLPIHTPNLRQIDLIAMRHGWQITGVEDLEDGWTSIRFVRGGR